MNVFIVLPQLVVALLAGPLVSATDDPSSTMLVGAVFGVVAAGLVWRIPKPPTAVDIVNATTRLVGDEPTTDVTHPLVDEETPRARLN